MQANLSRSLVVSRRKARAGKRKSNLMMSTRELRALAETAGRSGVAPSLSSGLAPTPCGTRAVSFPSAALNYTLVCSVQVGACTGVYNISQMNTRVGVGGS